MSNLHAAMNALRAAGFGGKDGEALPVQVFLGFAVPDDLPAAVAHGFRSIMPWTTTPRDVGEFADPGAPGVTRGAVHETSGACAAPPGVPFGAAAANTILHDQEDRHFAVVRGGRAGYEGKGKPNGKGRVSVLRGGRAGYEGKGKPNSKGRQSSDTVLRGGRPGYHGNGKSKPKASAAVATAVAATTATAVGSFMTD
jgi:hypothetical protein